MADKVLHASRLSRGRAATGGGGAAVRFAAAPPPEEASTDAAAPAGAGRKSRNFTLDRKKSRWASGWRRRRGAR